jgi:hypothetical protein
MFIKNTFRRHYFKHSLRLLIRYQQIYAYPLIVVVFILLPKLFNINDAYYTYLFSLNLFIVLWLLSPFYLCQFSFSPEDTRSWSLFSINIRELVLIRNRVSFMVLLVPFLLNLVLCAFLYQVTDKVIYGMIFLSIVLILPAVSTGNLFTPSSLSWTSGSSISWKSLFIVLIAFLSDMVIKVSFHFLSNLFIALILISMFLLYLLLYLWSYRKINKEILKYLCSIVEK